jgi:hypothetical protein
MIKKQLGLLAGSLMVAASSSAEIPLDSNVLFVFNTAGAGTYYQKYGSPAQSLADGFSIDLSAASAALGGSIDSFAILAVSAGACSPTASNPYPCYNYDEFLYVELGGGFVYTADSLQATTNSYAQAYISIVQNFLSGAELGLNNEGSDGDFDANANVSGLLISSWPGGFSNNLQYFPPLSTPPGGPSETDYPLVLNKQTVIGTTTEPCAVLGNVSCLASPFQDTPAVIVGSKLKSTMPGDSACGELVATDIDGLTDGTYFAVTSPPVYGQAQINPATGVWNYSGVMPFPGGYSADPFTVTVTDDLGGSTEQVIGINLTTQLPFQQKLTASDGAPDDYFGTSVSISGDTAVIGARLDDDNGTQSGSAYVYVRSNCVWSEQQKLTASDGAQYDQFGSSVSISGDTAVIGALADEDNGTISGSAYVYVRSNGVWTEQQKLTASDGEQYDYFGTSVSISGDTAVIGAYRDDDNGSNSGSAYVYVRSNGVWSEQQKLTASDGAPDDYFGFTVSISGDTAVMGAYGDDDNGSAYVYVRGNGVWTQQQKLTASDGAQDDNFWSVSISGDTAVMGAPYDNDNGSYSGSAYVYDFYLDAPAVITGSLEGSTTQGGFTFGTLQATDIDGLTDGTYFSVSTAPLYGQAQINPSTGLWTYLAEAVYVGADPFTVTVTDDLGGTTEQVIAMTAIGIDTDSDTIYDTQDNCPLTPNTNQLNLDNDALGDECDEDIDGDGVDNDLDTFPLDPSETTDTDLDTVGDNSDNCVNDANTNQLNIDGDSLGDMCDPDMDGDGVANAIELYFGGDETNSGDAAVSQANILALSETAQQDADYDGVPDEVEAILGEDNTSSTLQDLISALNIIGKNVPAMGGIGLFVMFSSLIGLGLLKRKKN